MRGWMGRRSAAGLALAGLVVLAGVVTRAAPVSAQDGFPFLERGSGFREVQPPEDEPAYAPLEMRVRPHRPAARAAGPRGPNVTAARPRLRGESRVPGSPRDVIAAQTEAYARLDPANRPDWYLRDSTLRPGDLVVLKNGIRVFTGDPETFHMPGDFRPLDDAGLSASERQALGRSAPLGLN